MIEIDLKVGFSFERERLLPQRLENALRDKFVDASLLLYKKVMENVTGLVLQKRTGQLAESIRIHTAVSRQPMTATIGPEPATMKAWVHEYGGKGWYDILPVKADVLRFVNKEGALVFAKSVRHPPARERAYLASALEEVMPQVEDLLRSAIDSALEE